MGLLNFAAFILQEEEDDELCAGELVSVSEETGSHFFTFRARADANKSLYEFISSCWLLFAT